jgi:superfamily II DNA or RNA helicase/uncharacterized tellurite resistance protein B-like protein
MGDYASVSIQERRRLYQSLGPPIQGLLAKLAESTRVLTHLRNSQCNPKSVYWELPAFVAPILGALALELKSTAERLGGWLFVDEIARATGCDRVVVANLVKLASLLQIFGCRLAEGRLIFTEAARSSLIQHLERSALVPGPASALGRWVKDWFGREVEEATLCAVIGTTLSPGVVVEVDRKRVIFSLDRQPSVRDLLLGGMRLWKGPLSLQDLQGRLRRLELFNGSRLELEMELHGLKAEGLLRVEDDLFGLDPHQPDGAVEVPSGDLANLVFQTLFEIATADQIVRPEEMAVISNLMAIEFDIKASQREPFETLLTLAVHRSLGHEELGQPLRPQQLQAYPQELRDRVFRSAVAVAFIDQEVHATERLALDRLAQRLQTSLPSSAVVARFEEICRAPYTEYAYFGILPDLSHPGRLQAKLLRLHEHTLERLARGPLERQEVKRIQALLSDFQRQVAFAETPWLLTLDLNNPPLPTQTRLPLHCFLRVARADGPMNETEVRTVNLLVRSCLQDDQDKALWNLQRQELSNFKIADAPPFEPDMRCLSFCLVVALCDGPLNVDKSRELLSVASDLGVSERSFQILHRLEQATRKHLEHDPGLEHIDRLERALDEAENPPATSPPSSSLLHPLVLPELEPGGHPYMLVIRPSGRHNFIVNLRVRPELQGVPFLQERLLQAIEERPGLREICQERSWGLCKGVPACLRLIQEVKESPFEVHWPHGQPFQVLGKAGLHNLRATISQKQGWFEIGGRLQVGQGHSIGLLDLVERVRDSPDAIAITPDTFLHIDEALRQQLLQLDAMLPDDMPPGCLDPLRARLLAGQFNLFEDLTHNQEFSRMGALLEEAREIKPDLPPAVWNQLRDYQKEGIDWMLRTLHTGLGVCLADDMGLGKTLQTLCVLYHRRALGLSLVVAPTSVTYNWKEQAQRFLPDLRVYLYEGLMASRHAEWERLSQYDVVVVSYGIFHRDHARLGQREWNCLVLDEAQKIKNPSSATARTAFTMKARARVATTGTPIENHLMELWSLMNFLNPGLLGSQSSFRQTYLQRLDDSQDPRRLHRLRVQVGHFILRRRKETVAPQLPPKSETVHRIDLSAEEREFYNSIRRQALEMQKEDRISLLSALTRLRQACCDPALIDSQWGGMSSKLSAALEILGEVSAEGHPILVFSQFVSLLTRLAGLLNSEGLPYRELYGSTPVEERRSLVDDFQQGRFRIFLISLKAGGTGLTLTRAGYVLHLDPWWNPAVEDQATDRAHRIGQTQTVHVYRLIARETVEEKVLELHASKRELAESVLGQDGSPSVLSLDDLRALL